MKYIQIFKLAGKSVLPSGCVLMAFDTLDGESMPPIAAGQFVQVKIDGCPEAMLRRPISVCNVGKQLLLFVRPVGPGTRTLTSLDEGALVNMILPLGHGFSIDSDDVAGKKALLVGGGVGCAPLVKLSHDLAESGADVTVIVGGRTSTEVEGLQNLYHGAARIEISTDDGSEGAPGLVTANPAFVPDAYDRIYCCGPTPMMKAVARAANAAGVWCEVSLENRMACGIGACLCCVEDTDHGNVCVCTEGPVFNINRLPSWL